jgi:hypothetical protein
MSSGEEALAEVAGDDFFRIANGGQIDTTVPAKQYIDIRRYTMEEAVMGGGSRAVRICPVEKRSKQFGDAIRRHDRFDCRRQEETLSTRAGIAGECARVTL